MFRLDRIAIFTSRLHLQLHRAAVLQLFSSSSSIETNNVNRTGPPPIRVSLTESAGRGVFATRRIGAGDLIHTAKPFVSYPSMSTIHSVCYFCLRKLGESEHSRDAQFASFCNVECAEQSKTFCEVEARADWSAFDEYCRVQGLKYPFVVKRLACMVIAGSDTADCLDVLQPASLSTNMISEMEEGFNLLRSAFEKANLVDGQIAFLNKQWYISLLARIRINAFRVELAGGSYEDLLSLASASVESEVAVGNAVYMLPSFYNHDCDPNAHIIWLDNAFARMKALRDIETGEELRICYIDASLNHDARQALLYQGFGFRCTCPRCLSGD